MGGGEVVKKGYLIKSPPLDGKGMKNWHKRFFCLYSSKIFEYYKTEGGEKKGVINLEDCTSVNAGLQHKKYQHVFDIETSDRTYYLVASSEEEMTEWVDTLCRVCEFIIADDAPPPVQPRSLSLQPNHAATLQPTNFSSTGNPKFTKERAQSLAVTGTMPGATDNLYSLAGQDATYGQHKPGIPLSDYFEQSGVAQARRTEGDSRTSLSSVTSNGPPPAGISLSEALSMKGYGTLGQCTVGPAVPPRTPLNEALQIKGFSQMSVTEGDSASSTASMVREAEIEVKRMLRQKSLTEVQVKPGTPLNEALAQKGIINSPGGGGFGSSQSSTSRSGSVPDDNPEDHYNVPRNNQPAFFPEDEVITPPPRYQSLPRNRPAEGHYQSPRSLMDDPPDQLYNVPPPPRPAPVPRTSPSRKKRSTLLTKDADSEATTTTPAKVNGVSPPPTINRSNKPRPPPVNREIKPGRSESFRNDIPTMTKDSVHYVSLTRIKDDGKPTPRPRSTARKTDYSEVDLEGTLAMEKKFTIKEDRPQVPERTRDSLMDVYSSDDDDDDSAGSDISYTKMRRFTFEEADKPDTYYQSPRQALEEEFDDPRESLPTGL